MCGTHRSGGVTPVELKQAARLGHVRRPGGACHPFAQKREKGAAMSMVSGVFGGVDTHADVHVAAAIDENGGVLGIESFPTNGAGYERLTRWLTSFDPVVKVGVEGTGSFGFTLGHLMKRRSGGSAKRRSVRGRCGRAICKG